jgi:hypothetical protein
MGREMAFKVSKTPTRARRGLEGGAAGSAPVQHLHGLDVV